MKSVKLLSQIDYTKSVKNYAVWNSKIKIKTITTRYKIVKEYITRFKSLVTLTKKQIYILK